ncbi:Riboflavin kinase / FMN adenylyltransferase [Lachnospiraceae bacterium TWA4]|nr:Riboflavin kinase / FMN adenylyltransferase [Lachnospiraceae bacterium TWA4]
MKILQDTKNLNIETFSIVTLGKFDGFHLGHQALFQKMFELKKKTGYPIILFTFSVSPRTHIKGEPPQFLLSNPERESWLAKNWN